MDYEIRQAIIESLCDGHNVASRLDQDGNIVFWQGDRPKPTEEEIAAAYKALGDARVKLAVEKKLAEIANDRFSHETGGLKLPNGIVIKTDRESQALLTGAALSASMDPETPPVEWKGVNGWAVLKPADVLGIAGLVRKHVQACFSREKELSARVQAIAEDPRLAEDEKLKAIEAVRW